MGEGAVGHRGDFFLRTIYLIVGNCDSSVEYHKLHNCAHVVNIPIYVRRGDGTLIEALNTTAQLVSIFSEMVSAEKL